MVSTVQKQLQNYQNSREQERANTRALLEQAQALPAMDFTPLAAYVDAQTGSNLAASSRPNISSAQKAQLIQGYQGMLNKMQSEDIVGQLTGFSPAQKKIDQEFGKEYASFFATGKFADAQKGIEQLRGVSEALGSKEGLAGGATGFLPMAIRKRLPSFSEGANVQQLIEEVVQRNLRLILGAQFTKQEGERLINRAYDPAFSQATNKKRIDRLLKQMEDAADAKLTAGKYLEKEGTLKGYPGTFQYQQASNFIDEIDKIDEKTQSKGIPDFENMSDEELAKYVGG